MTSQIVLKLKPEEEELFRKRQELSATQAVLAESELELAELSRQLSAFESLYLRKIGTLYAELDDWNARIAEFEAQVARSSGSAQRARAAREHARQTYEAAHDAASNGGNFDPSPDLKRLFHEVAKRFHPDLAKDGADHEQRTKYMAEANRAYRAGDVETLRQILEGEDCTGTDPKFSERVGTELVRIIRQISRAKERVRQIELDLKRLRESEIALLRAAAEKTQELGRDLIAELSARLKAEIKVARKNYETLISSK